MFYELFFIVCRLLDFTVLDHFDIFNFFDFRYFLDKLTSSVFKFIILKLFWCLKSSTMSVL